MVDSWGTRRERIVETLRESESPLSVEQIAQILELDSKEVMKDLKHIVRSLHKSKWQLVMIPPKCLRCGYVFSLEKPKKPSKCPRCKGERISSPLFKIVYR